jgi:hypothetical protein
MIQTRVKGTESRGQFMQFLKLSVNVRYLSHGEIAPHLHNIDNKKFNPIEW